MKKCKRCQEQKPLDDFYDNNKPGVKNPYCIPCVSVMRRAKTYDVTEEELLGWLKITECQICNIPVEGKEKHIDHCHDTGKIRGVLCRGCNQGIGNFNEDIRAILRAASYLYTKK